MSVWGRGALLLLLLTEELVQAAKVWRPTDSMDDPDNWQRKAGPSECDRVLLNTTAEHTILMSKYPTFAVKSVVLPSQAIVRFPQYSSLTFSSDENCPVIGSDAQFEVRGSARAWLDPENWQGDAVGKGGWLPHKAMVPSTSDTLVFYSTGRSFVGDIDLPSVLVPYSEIILNNQTLDADGWQRYLQSEEGYESFHGAADVRNRKWRFQHECSCSTPYKIQDWSYVDVSYEEFYSAICQFVNSCDENALPCYHGVHPDGHCCTICGSLIDIESIHLGNSLMDSLGQAEALSVLLTSVEELCDNVVPFYVGHTSKGNIQVVIVAPHGDSLQTATLAQQISATFQQSYPKWQGQLRMRHSGMSKGYSLAGHLAGPMFGTLLAVLSCFAVIYYVYMVLPANRLGRLTQKNPFEFARFRSKLHSAASSETLAFESPPAAAESFENPLYTANLKYSGSSSGAKLNTAVAEQLNDATSGVALSELPGTSGAMHTSRVESEGGTGNTTDFARLSQLQVADKSDTESVDDFSPY